jgi:anti-sigma factor RsiW
MRKTTSPHISEAAVEKYSLGKLSARKVAEIEKHLLICEPCRKAVAASDAYVAAMSKAAGKLRKSERKSEGKGAGK